MSPNTPSWTPEKAKWVKEMLDRLAIRPPYKVRAAGQSERMMDAQTFGTDEIVELLSNAEDMYACLTAPLEASETFTATKDEHGRWEFRDTRLSDDVHIKWDGSNPCAVVYKGEHRLNHLDILIEETVTEQAKARLENILADTVGMLASDNSLDTPPA